MADAGPSSQPQAVSPGTALALVLVGLVSFVALGVLLAFGWRLQGDRAGGANALSRSAVGYAGVVRLLRETGRPVSLGRGQERQHPRGGLLILAPPLVSAHEAALTRLMAGEARPILLVAPKWEVAPAPAHPGWVTAVGLTNLGMAAAPLQRASSGLKLAGQAGVARHTLRGSGPLSGLAPLRTGPIRALRTLDAAGAQTLLVDESGDAVLARTPQGVLLLSEPDLLDNLGLADPQTAASAVALVSALDADGGEIVFDVSLAGFGRARSLLGLALAPPFLGASLCVLAAGLLMGAHAAVRFGPVREERRAFAQGKAALLDNCAVLIARAGREPAMGGRYAALVRRSLAPRLPGRRYAAAGPEAEDAALDRLAPEAQPGFAMLARAAEGARDTPTLMRAVRALHQRQAEILGEAS